MNDRIQILLDKYLEGETTLDEERELNSLIAKSGQAEHKAWKKYFSASDTFGKTRIPSDQDDALLDQFSESNTSTIHQLNTFKQWMAIASSLLVIFLAGHWISRYEPLQWSEGVSRDSYESPKTAMEETQKALAFFSDKYQKGKAISSSSMEETKYIDRYFNFNSKER